MIIFKLYVPGAIEENIISVIISFMVVLAIFCVVTYHENKKRFHGPLRQLKLVLNDLKTE